jgi:hypothetical protein
MNGNDTQHRRESVISSVSQRSEVSDLMDFNALTFGQGFAGNGGISGERRHSYQPPSSFKPAFAGQGSGGIMFPHEEQEHTKRRKLSGFGLDGAQGQQGYQPEIGDQYYMQPPVGAMSHERNGSHDIGYDVGAADLLQLGNNMQHYGNLSNDLRRSSLGLHEDGQMPLLHSRHSSNVGQNFINDLKSDLVDNQQQDESYLNYSSAQGAAQWDPNNFDSNLKM